MLADQAGWHIAQNLEVPENIRLIKLPPRSPELNPAEHIWEELREKNFSNKACRDLDEVEDNLCRGLITLLKSCFWMEILGAGQNRLAAGGH
jgi:transposase